ncbi:MAG: hypothetical protein GY737_26615 [Desulfobacteraceae bacterium]|nr:hypothetical protein [Desulfobacteraceae bacterium]
MQEIRLSRERAVNLCGPKQIVQSKASASGLSLPVDPTSTIHIAGMLPEHMDASDVEFRLRVKEMLKEHFRKQETEYLIPVDQPAELWDPSDGTEQKKKRVVRVQDSVLSTIGTMRGYGGRSLDGNDRVELVRDRQALWHAVDRLRDLTSQSGFQVLFIDLEGIQLPAAGKPIPAETWELMHRTKAAEPGGATASLMQIATVSGECVLIDLFAFRLTMQGQERGSVGVFAKEGEVEKGDKVARGAEFGGRVLGPCLPDPGPGAGFEFSADLARLLGNHILVCFAGDNDKAMLIRSVLVDQVLQKDAVGPRPSTKTAPFLRCKRSKDASSTSGGALRSGAF